MPFIVSANTYKEIDQDWDRFRRFNLLIRPFWIHRFFSEIKQCWYYDFNQELMVLTCQYQESRVFGSVGINSISLYLRTYRNHHVDTMPEIESISKLLVCLDQWFSTFFRLRHLLTQNLFCETQMCRDTPGLKTTGLDLNAYF